MITSTLAIGLVLLIAAFAAAHVHVGQRKQRQAVADSLRIEKAVKDYFTRSHAEVSSQCLHVHGRFMVLVESEPLKRFRYSNIVEASLVGHVEKTQGLQVDRVFWRFPLPVGTSSPLDTADIKPAARGDEYIAEGIREAKTNPDYHVAEDSWDQFEMAQKSEAVTPFSSPAEEAKRDQGN